MGYVRHHAIIVTSSGDAIQEAHKQASSVFADVADVTALTSGAVNGYRSFMVAPDGSPEWWDHSDMGDAKRAEFVAWLRQNGLVWVEVQFGDDEGATLIVSDSDDMVRKGDVL